MTPFLPISKAELSTQDADAIKFAILRAMAAGKDPRAEVAAIIYVLTDAVLDALPRDHPTHKEMYALKDFVDGATEWGVK